MDSDPPPPPRSAEGLRVPGFGASGTAESSRQGAARRSPSPSAMNHPATPSATEETADNYFPSLSQTSTQAPSMRSVRSSSRPTSLRPAVSAAPSAAGSTYGSRPGLEDTRQPSIRLRRNSNTSLSSLRRTPSNTAAGIGSTTAHTDFGNNDNGFQGNRPRSISQPERARTSDNVSGMGRHPRRQAQQVAMPRLTEEGSRPTMAELGVSNPPMSPVRSLPDETFYPTTEDDAAPSRKKLQRRRKVSRLFWPGKANEEDAPPPPTRAELEQQRAEDEYDEQLVDWLDTIDPEVQTLSTLTNVQNSLFIPDLGKWVNRRPTYSLSQHDPQQRPQRPGTGERAPTEIAEEPQEEPDLQPYETATGAPPMQRSSTITSRLTESHYAALPHGASLEGWSADDKRELDDHVRHMLHSRRARFKRTMKGFGQYVRRPLGFFVTLYAFCITAFGLAWVLFLIGWIYVGDKQVYTIHIIDSVLVALFAIMGDGLAPFRAIDTYHLLFVTHYTRKIKKAAKGSRPRSKLQKRNTAEQPPPDPAMADSSGFAPQRPAVREGESSVDWNTQDHTTNYGPEVDFDADPEDAKSSNPDAEDSPLTYKQQQRLEHHKKKLAKSHSFYKPRETFTHNAFPLKYLVAVVVLLDCHSCLQISLGATTWGIDYHGRNPAITTTILCISITCNITAGLVISFGDKKTRKKDVVNLLDRQELTGDAIRHIEEKRKKEYENNGQPSPDIPAVNLDILEEEPEKRVSGMPLAVDNREENRRPSDIAEVSPEQERGGKKA